VVRDEQGGVLPGVNMTLRNEGSGVTRTLVTDGNGRYSFPALSPARYALRAELAGFATAEIHGIVITIGLGLRQDVVMKVEALEETVTVTGEAPVVDTTKAEVAGIVTREQIETLPINSRQYLSLALLVPGSTVDGTRSFFATVNVGGSVTFNGTGNIVDGMINTRAEGGEPRQDLPEDAVEEFKVTNSSYKAEFGLATGGRGPGRYQVRDQPLSRYGVRVLSQQGAQFEGRLRVAEARVPAAPVRLQRRRSDRAGSRALLRGGRADRHAGELYGGDRAAAVLFGARGHLSFALLA
jgi:hypothetical protein